MGKIALDLKIPALRALNAQGFKLSGLRATKRLAAGSRIEGPTSILSLVAPGAYLDVGAFCNLSGGSINNLRAGRYCSIASGVVIGPHEHPTDWLTTSRIAYFPQVNDWDDLLPEAVAAEVHALKRPFQHSCPVTTLGPDVWVGQGAFLKAGVAVGAGAIVGARATVLRDVPPYTIVVGTPARVLRLRFSESVVERLLSSEWWRYSIYDLFDAPFDDIERALGVIEARIAAGDLAPFAGPVVGPAELAHPEASLGAALTLRAS